MKAKQIIARIFILLCPFFLVSCLDMTIKVAISLNGKVKLDVIAKSDCVWIDQYALAAMYADADLERTKYWRRGSKCYFKGSNWGNVKSFRLGKFVDVNVSAGKGNGVFSNNYRFATYLGEFDKEASSNPYAELFLKGIRVHYYISLPGKITKTTGRISQDGRTASFHYNLYTLSKGKRKLFVESSVGRFGDILDAKAKAALIIDEKRQELYRIESRLQEMSYRLSREKKYIKNQGRYISQTNRNILNLMNSFVKFFYKENKSYPSSKAELFDFLENQGIDIDDLPYPIEAELTYHPDKHIFIIEKAVNI